VPHPKQDDAITTATPGVSGTCQEHDNAPDKPSDRDKAWALTMQPTQKAPIYSVSTDNMETPYVSALNWTEAVLSRMRDIADQLRTMDSQLSAIEQQPVAVIIGSQSLGPQWRWGHSELDETPASRYQTTGSRLSEDPPKGRALAAQPWTGADCTHPHQLDANPTRLSSRHKPTVPGSSRDMGTTSHCPEHRPWQK